MSKNFMKNENNKYIKYKAYGQLYKLFMTKLEDLHVDRPNVNRIESLLTISHDEIKEKIENPEISLKDNIKTIIDKKYKIEYNELYMLMLHEAYEVYKNAFVGKDRPTMKQVDKILHSVLDTIIDDLLLL